jgi:anti-sigma B factor antagonist
VDLTLERDKVGAATYVVAVSGEADLYTAPQLKHELHALVDAGATALVVDLTNTTFIDSTTLGVLLSALRRIRPNGGDIALVCSDRNVRRIFDITMLDRVFTITETRDEALASLAKGNTPAD